MANLNIRVTDAEKQRLERSAEQAGETLTGYVLNWLPDTYQRQDTNGQDEQPTQRRGARAD